MKPACGSMKLMVNSAALMIPSVIACIRENNIAEISERTIIPSQIQFSMLGKGVTGRSVRKLSALGKAKFEMILEKQGSLASGEVVQGHGIRTTGVGESF
jgi:hypothetical protein